jgi:hypothetical protein
MENPRKVDKMPDMEKVIKGVQDARRYLEDREWVDKSVGVHIDALNDALSLLKEQENEEERILKIVWDVLHGCVSTDTVEDQDWVYEQIRNRVHPMY